MTNRNGSAAGLFLLLALVSSVLMVVAPSRPERWFVVACLGMAGFTNASVLLLKKGDQRSVNWLTADVVFSFTFTVVHFVYFIYWWFGFIPTAQEIWYFRGADCPDTVCTGLSMYLIALNCFLVGYHAIRSKRQFPILREYLPPESILRNWRRVANCLVRAGFLGFLLFIVIVGPQRFFGVYSGTNNIVAAANVFFQMGQVLLICGVAVSMACNHQFLESVNSRRAYRFKLNLIDCVLVCSTVIAIGVHGDRSTILSIVTTCVVGYSEFVRPIRFKVLVVGALLLVFTFGVIVAVRQEEKRSLDLNFVENLNGAFLNFGSSAVCGFVAIDHTEKVGFQYGKMQFRQLLGIVPYGRRLFGVKDTLDNSSSMLLTKLIQGRVGKGTSGTGTTVFADIYFDFGLIGAIVVFFLVGLLAKWVQNLARTSTSLLAYVAFVALVTFLTVCSRYTFSAGLIREVGYAAGYTLAVCFVLSVPTKYYLGATPAFLRSTV